MNTSARIHDIPTDDKPRERAVRLGIQALTNAELIGVLLRTGLPGENAVAVGARLERTFGSLNGLARVGIRELMNQGGLGPAKAVELAAAFELGIRARREELRSLPMSTPMQVCDYFGQEMRALPVEVVRVILVNTKLQLISVEEIFRGSVNESLAHPREILQPVIRTSAYGFVLVHNHPSGDPTPSDADLRLTRRLNEAAEIMQIRFLDHVIIGAPAPDRQPYYSFREGGFL